MEIAERERKIGCMFLDLVMMLLDDEEQRLKKKQVRGSKCKRTVVLIEEV